MTNYSTLDEALAEVATRSLYDDATVTPKDDGYEVEDDHATAFPGDVLLWGDVSGVDWPARADDHSRMHEPCESYATAEHIRYNLGDAVEALEAGQVVTFAYAIIDAVACDEHEHLGECECDRTAGWALLAAIDRA